MHFFSLKTKPSLSLSPYLYVENEEKTYSCFLFNSVAHLDNKEVNLVRGQLLNPRFWCFAACPEPAEQRQCRFHPPCPIAIQRETVGSRHKAPFQESVASMYSLFFFLFNPNHWTFTELLHFQSLRGNSQEVFACCCAQTLTLLGELHCSPTSRYLRPFLTWILLLCHLTGTCITS